MESEYFFEIFTNMPYIVLKEKNCPFIQSPSHRLLYIYFKINTKKKVIIIILVKLGIDYNVGEVTFV